MPQGARTLKGYVKTSNMYLIVLLVLSVGFLGGVLFSSYRMASVAPLPQGKQAPPGMAGNSPSAGVPLTKAQSETLAALIEATKATPDNVQAWTQLAHFYFDSGNPDKAITAYEKSLTLDPNRPDVWTDMGVMYRRTGNPKKAIEAFERALSIKSSHEVAMFNMGVVLMHDLNDKEGAITSWEALVKVNPNAQAPNGQLIRNLVTELKSR